VPISCRLRHQLTIIVQNIAHPSFQIAELLHPVIRKNRPLGSAATANDCAPGHQGLASDLIGSS
jgi:hypothetical protein